MNYIDQATIISH